MEGGIMIDSDGSRTTFEPYGIDTSTGEQLISVTPISINDFEEKANDDEFLYNYSVIVFGTWDASTGYGISTETAKGAVTRYINKGYGFLAGHDSIVYSFYINNQATSLLSIRDLFGIKSNYTDNTYNGKNINYKYIQESTVTIVRKGLLTNYPYQIGDIGTVLTIPTTHTYSHATTGDVWMTLGTNANPQTDSAGLQHNFYLTTKDNTAMIQTGHSNCESTIEERKIIVNTIYYLNQRTSETFAEDHSSQDYESPTVNLRYEEKSYRVHIDSIDKGTKYRFKVQALLKSNDDVYAESEPVEVTVTTGVDHYIYTVTNDQSVTIDALASSTKDDYIYLNSKQVTNGMNVFVAAVDGAGNIGNITSLTIPIPDATPSKSPSPSRSPSISASASRSPSISASASRSPSISASASRSPSISASASRSPSISASASVSKSPTLSQSPHPTPSRSHLISTEIKTQKHSYQNTEIQAKTNSYSYGITLSNSFISSNSLTVSNSTFIESYSHIDDSLTFSYTLIYFLSFTETITFNSLISNSFILSRLNSEYTILHSKYIFYKYSVIKYPTYFSFYSGFFAPYIQNEINERNVISKSFLIGIICGAVAIVFIIIGIVFFLIRKKNIKIEKQSSKSVGGDDGFVIESTEKPDKVIGELLENEKDLWI
ncbi:DUF5057 domain-containing protein [Histomonas meleagridis]|nr:DUF5057 domain-containing protein [Histomonas meleagridis]